uniref:HhH-GPD domain-containing protein n=1 Tax=Graphocephala atropunctata TaxID=36148 RepID=A0A1B6MDG2_9HEMI
MRHKMTETVGKIENINKENGREEQDNLPELLYDNERQTNIVTNVNTKSLCTSENECNQDNQNESPSNPLIVSESGIENNVNKQLLLSPSLSKHRLAYTKRRAGVLYKQLRSSKLCKVNSKYFNEANKTKKRWIPPRSPYSLVQEDLFDNPWQLLVATIFLTKTTAKRAIPQLHKFLSRYSRPEDVLQASYEDIDEYFKPLGLTTTRSHIIMRFTDVRREEKG